MAEIDIKKGSSREQEEQGIRASARFVRVTPAGLTIRSICR